MNRAPDNCHHTDTHCFRLSCTLLLLLMLSFSRFFFFLPILLLIFLLFPSLFFLLHPSFLSLSSSLLFVFFVSTAPPFCFSISSALDTEIRRGMKITSGLLWRWLIYSLSYNSEIREDYFSLFIICYHGFGLCVAP